MVRAHSSNKTASYPGAVALHGELFEIVSSLDEGSDLHPAMDGLFRIAERLMPADCFYLSIRQGDAYHVLFETDLDDQNRRIYLPVPRTTDFTRSPVMQRLQAKDHIAILRTPAEVRRLESADVAGTPTFRTMGNPRRRSTALLFVPIRFNREFVGMIAAQNYRFLRYGPAHVARLKTIADYVSLALHAIQTTRRMNQSVRGVLRQTGDVLDRLEKYAEADATAVRRQIDLAEMAVSRLADELPATQA